MSVELGSIWIDNDSDSLVTVKSLEGSCNGKVKVVFNYIVREGSGCFEATSGLDLFLNTKTKLVRNNEGDYSKGYEHGVQHMKMQNSIDKYSEMSDKLSLTEQEFEGIIDGAFEEGYAQAYSELQTKTERERALQEKAWDEGYDQAVYDLIDDGIVDGLDEEDDYSEYEFGAVEDDEEEYCFSKELERVLNGEFTDNINFDKDKKDGVWKGSSAKGYDFKVEEDGAISGFRVTAEKDGASMGNRFDENGKLCGFFINTGNEKIGGIKGSERKHSHYFKDVRHLDYIDVYELNKLFPIDDDTDCILHARKKLLVCGGRGGSKDMITDITDARDTLNRYLQIEGIE